MLQQDLIVGRVIIIMLRAVTLSGVVAALTASPEKAIHSNILNMGQRKTMASHIMDDEDRLDRLCSFIAVGRLGEASIFI
jgi:hypothetical protein